MPKYQDWGLIPYKTAMEQQLQLLEDRIYGHIPDTLVLLEHAPVYTLGSRIGAESHLLWDESTRQKKGITLAKTNRGGDVTYHGPGQLVGYPIVSLEPQKDLHAYLRFLEEVLIQTLTHWGLSATRRPEKTGIWLENRKIAAIGVAARQWVAYHGFALNVSTDLSAFAGIVPCGIKPEDGTVTSMEKELGKAPPMQAVKEKLAEIFWQLLIT